MKTLNDIIIKVIMASGLFLNATAQDDLTGLRIPDEFHGQAEMVYTSLTSSTAKNDCCELENTAISESSELSGNSNSWIKSENTISITDLPKAILKTLVREYDAYALLKVEEIETSVREAYKLRVVQENAQWDIYISSKGDILMEEKIS